MSVTNYLLPAEAYNGEETLPVTLHLTYDEFQFEPAQCEILTDDYDNFRRLFSADNTVKIRSTNDWGEKFLVRFVPTLNTSHTIHGYAKILIKSLGTYLDFDISPQKVICYLTIPSTPLVSSSNKDFFLHEQRGILGKPKPTGLYWNTRLGKAEIVQVYSSRIANDVLHYSRIETSKYEIRLNINSERFDSIDDVIDSIKTELADDLLLLSFLSKRIISWYDATIYVENTSIPFDVRYAVFLGKKLNYDATTGHPNHLFINPDMLLNDKLNQMIIAYRQSTERNAISQVIQYILVSFDEIENYPAIQFSLMWTALEILVDQLTHVNRKIIGSSKFKKITNKIKKVLAKELNEEELQKMILKLPELQRNTFKTRLLILFETYDINPSIFWPQFTEHDKTRLEQELASFIKRRNQYIHTGRIDNHIIILRDVSRIRYIATYIILKILKYPMDKIHQYDTDIILSRKTP